MKFSVLIPEKISLNKIHAGVHWTVRRQWVEDMHIAVLAAKIAPYEGLFPIDCAYHFKLNGTLLDSSNTAFMQKLVEDGLVQAGIIPDDSRKYVRWVAKLSDKCAKGEYDSVEVTFSPACGQT